MLVLALAACRGHASSPAPTGPDRPPRLRDLAAQLRLRGAWRWIHTSSEDGTYRIERERWMIDAIDGAALTGRYRRDLIVISLDGSPFVCSQQAVYAQVAVYDVRVTARHDAITIEETGYRTMASPCEPGFRKLGSYRATVDDDRHVTLAWDGGAQTLTTLGGELYRPEAVALPPVPEDPAGALGGAWAWSMRSRDEEGDVRDEAERWELAIGDDGTVGGTYERSVVVSASDGKDFPCAGAPAYGFVDRYTVRGGLDAEGGLRFDEVAVEPGQHACLDGVSDRHLDSAAGRADGAFLVLTWRGQRRQVLHR